MDRSMSLPKTITSLKFALIAALAAFLLPISGAGEVLAGEQSDQNRRIREIFQDARAEVRDARGNVIATLKDGVAKRIPEENFEDQVKDVGTALRNGQLNLGGIQKNLVYNLQNELGSRSPSTTSHNALLGNGGNADAFSESLFWDRPADDAKFIEKLGQRVRFRVEFEGSSENGSRFPTNGAHMATVTNPKLRLRLLYTQDLYSQEIYEIYGGPSLNGTTNGNGMIPSKKLRLDLVVGGAATNPSNGNFLGLACVFGTGQPNTSVNVWAIGLNGNFNQVVMTDSSGHFRADFDNMGPGISLYGALYDCEGMMEVYTEGLGGGEYEVCDEYGMSKQKSFLEMGLLADRFSSKD